MIARGHSVVHLQVDVYMDLAGYRIIPGDIRRL